MFLINKEKDFRKNIKQILIKKILMRCADEGLLLQPEPGLWT